MIRVPAVLAGLRCRPVDADVAADGPGGCRSPVQLPVRIMNWSTSGPRGLAFSSRSHTHVIPLGNYVSEAGNYVSSNPSDLGNYVSADSRIQSPENLRVTVPDQWLQVVALHHVLAAAEMARKHAPSAGMKPRIDAAIHAFLDSIIIGRGPSTNQRDAMVLARDVLEHFDDYYCGTGSMQRREQAADPGPGPRSQPLTRRC